MASNGTILKCEYDPSVYPKVRFSVENKKYTVTLVRTKLEVETNKTRKIFDVKGFRIEQVVKMTDLENPEGEERVFHFIKKMGIERELKRMGGSAGDKIRIAGKTLRMR